MRDADELHMDGDSEAKARAIAEARAVLAEAPAHDGHRHGVIVGMAVDVTLDGPPAVIAIIQDVAVPCWITLDEDDLARIVAYVEAALAAPEGKAESDRWRLDA
jgi:hypothetical protein